MTGPMQRILARAQPGSRGGVQQHVARGEVLRRLIEERWGLDRPEQWQAKHLRWTLERRLADLAPATRYAYYRTARAVAAALGHWPDWEPHLCGPWTSPTGTATRAPDRDRGGRPPKLAGRAKALRERDLPAGGGGSPPGRDQVDEVSRAAASSRALSRPSSRAARSRASAAAARALA